MAPHLDKLTFEVLQAELRDRGWGIAPHTDAVAEASIRAARNGREIYITLFATGTIRVTPAGTAEYEELRDRVRQDLQRAQDGVQQTLGREPYEFLDEADRESVLVSHTLCSAGQNLCDYSAFVMPLAKAFEGFAKKVLVRLGHGNPAQIDDPNFFRNAFGSQTYQALGANSADKRVLERVRNELPFSRHALMHSPPGPGFVIRERAAAIAKEGDILTLMRETATHFRGRI